MQYLEVIFMVNKMIEDVNYIKIKEKNIFLTKNK